MQHFLANPKEMYGSLWRHRDLIVASVKRDVLGRYRGSALGLLWSFLNPLLMLAVYTFVFSNIFKSRWPGSTDSKSEFALVLFPGLIIFSIFSECINRAPGVIVVHANYVKKVVFPLEILPFVSVISAMFHGAISFFVWVVAYVFLVGVPPATVIYFPLIMLPFLFFLMGLSWFLASLGVYLRDVAQLIGMATAVLMFLSPIFYPAASLPEEYRYLLYLNPITLVVEQVRAVLYFGVQPDADLLTVYIVSSALAAWLGFLWFQKTRRGFADVL